MKKMIVGQLFSVYFLSFSRLFLWGKSRRSRH